MPLQCLQIGARREPIKMTDNRRCCARLGAAMAMGMTLLIGTDMLADAAENGMSVYPKGFAGFMSGVLPPQPALYSNDYFYHFGGTASREVRDGAVETGADIGVNFGFLSETYVTDLRFFDAQYAFAGLFGWGNASITATASAPIGTASISAANNSLSDSFIAPVILGWHDGPFNWTFAANVYVPTGTYNLRRLNIGTNVWGFVPQFAATYFDKETGWDVSGSLSLVVTAENEATHYRSGDMLQLDWAAGKHFGAGGAWEGGIAGNVVYQVSGDSGAGARLGAFEERSVGIGPAISYATKLGAVPVSLSAKWERDVFTQNTFGGDVVTASATFVL